jgi:hypothetical protein
VQRRIRRGLQVLEAWWHCRLLRYLKCEMIFPPL